MKDRDNEALFWYNQDGEMKSYSKSTVKFDEVQIKRSNSLHSDNLEFFQYSSSLNECCLSTETVKFQITAMNNFKIIFTFKIYQFLGDKEFILIFTTN